MSKPILTLPCKYTISDFEQKASGHYCQSCDHTLKDFRNSTTEEMNEAIRSAGNKTCGIFYSNQVQPKTTVYQLGLQRRIGLSLLGILGFISPVVLTSCEDEKKTDLDSQAEHLSKDEIAFSKLKFPMTISGQLKDQNTNEPLAMSKIRLEQNGNILRTVETDERGFFLTILKKGDLSSVHFDLFVEHPGHKSDTIREVGNMSNYDRSHLNLNLEAYPKVIVDEHGEHQIITTTMWSGGLGAPDETELSRCIEENKK